MSGSKRVVMMVGLNHSGKTTFARALEKEVSDIVVIENDVWRGFAEQRYKTLRDKARENPKKSRDDPDLKTYHLKTMLPYAMTYGLPVCLANCNMYRSFRKQIIETVHDHGYRVCIVFMNIDYTLLLERAQVAHLHKNEAFYSGKTATGERIASDDPIVANLQWMRERFDIPDKQEADFFLEVSNIEEQERSIQQLVKILK